MWFQVQSAVYWPVEAGHPLAFEMMFVRAADVQQCLWQERRQGVASAQGLAEHSRPLLEQALAGLEQIEGCLQLQGFEVASLLR